MNLVLFRQLPRVTVLFTVALVVFICPARAVQRDHLTPAEADLVRDAQAIDQRTEVFIKAAERRLLLLTDPQAAQTLQAKQQAKQAKNKDKEKDKDKEDKELWGELPKGTRAELLTDLAGIFDEAITNIDDVASRNAKSSLLPHALKNLAAAATRFRTQLLPMRDTAADDEREALDNALSELQEIIDAGQKLPAETETKKAKP
jgi:hypothetical protein